MRLRSLAAISFVGAAAMVTGLAFLSSKVVEAQALPRAATGSLTANAQAVSITLPRGVTTATVDITGTFVGTVTFNVVGADADPVLCIPTGTTTGVTTATAPGKWVCPVTGWVSVNATVTAYTSGTIGVRLAVGP
jgi:hypothetical protein